MKHLIYLAIILLGVGILSSCTKEGGNQNSLVGTWKIVKVENFDKDGNSERVIPLNGNGNRLEFTESVFTLYSDNTPQGTAAYQYDKSSKRIVFGAGVCWLVQKFTAKELVLIIDESVYQKGEWGWSVYYCEKG